MKSRSSLAGLFVLFAGWQTSFAGTLTFDNPTSGTIADQNGLGTGFTQRLPGTGYALSANDPNLSLTLNPGSLTLQSTHADINQSPGPTGSNLGQLEAPGLFLPGVGTQNLTVSALFKNVAVPNESDQLLLYVGTSQNSVVRAGFAQQNVYLIVGNQGAGDVRPFLSDFNAFTPGDDVRLTFGRTGGLWQMTWSDLTNPSESGASPTVSLPWLDAQSDLYVGVMAANAGSDTPFTATIDSFTNSVVPEPSTFAMLAMGILTLSVIARRETLKRN